MERVDTGQVEHIMAGMECVKDFECYQTGFEKLGRVRDEGLDDYVWCLEEEGKARDCGFSLSFGDAVLCRCPLRVYVAKNLEK
jgi:hypothetical protein